MRDRILNLLDKTFEMFDLVLENYAWVLLALAVLYFSIHMLVFFIRKG